MQRGRDYGNQMRPSIQEGDNYEGQYEAGLDNFNQRRPSMNENDLLESEMNMRQRYGAMENNKKYSMRHTPSGDFQNPSNSNNLIPPMNDY